MISGFPELGKPVLQKSGNNIITNVGMLQNVQEKSGNILEHIIFVNRPKVTDAHRRACALLAQEAFRTQRISHRRHSKMPHRGQKVHQGPKQHQRWVLFFDFEGIPQQRREVESTTTFWIEKW